MSLHAGARLGPYEIVAPLGAGGMGEVYRARDTRLDRIVAIKILPSHVAQAPEAQLRFEREARAVSALNHPHICTLHDIGRDNGIDYMVMECVEGETLASRLEKGPLPLDQALTFAIQIGDALDKAHRRGVVHRDLKPGNIMLGPAGVKILDFGLAKIGQKQGAAVASGGSLVETLTTPLTGQGSIVGTLQYMAPEQLEGKEADARTDIFAFGAVLYEMLTGRRPFDGRSHAGLISAIMTSSPPSVSSLQPVTPPLLERLVSGCLEKNADDRWQTAHDVTAQLKWIAAGGSQAGVATPNARNTRKTALITAIALTVLCLLLAGATTRLWLLRPAPDARAVQFLVNPPLDTIFTAPYGATSVSPDGRFLVFAASSSGRSMLWLRPFDSLTARPLPGTDNGNFPFWSPDSKSLAFFADGKLQRIEVVGGAPLVLCDAQTVGTGSPIGGAWSSDGVIIFGVSGALQRVLAAGGEPAPLTKIDSARQEISHGAPQFLPDGKRFLYFIVSGNPNTQGIYAGSLEHTEKRARIVGTNAKAVFTTPHDRGPGHLLWLRGQTLFAQPFDPAKLQLEGEPAPVAMSVGLLNTRASFWVSDAGLVVYRAGAGTQKFTLTWRSRDGKPLGFAAQEGRYGSVRLAPDGRRAALSRIDSENEDIWLLEFGRAMMTRLTFDEAVDFLPVWSPDSSQVAFSSERNGTNQLYRKSASGAGQEEQLTSDRTDKRVTDWSPDGRYILYSEVAPSSILAQPLEGGKPITVVQTRFLERSGQFSPDSKWVAYESDESGRVEVYVQAFPPSGGKWQVSSQGGSRPRWRGDGKELFYLAGGKMMAAAVKTTPGGVETGSPIALFEYSTPVAGSYQYDVTSDGQRFLLLAPLGTPDVSPLTVISNWQAGLKK